MLTWEEVRELGNKDEFYIVSVYLDDIPEITKYTIDKDYPFYFDDEGRPSYINVKNEKGGYENIVEYEFGEEVFLREEDAKAYLFPIVENFINRLQDLKLKL